jgi:hypothetical protein
MLEKRLSVIFLEIFAVVAILATLSAVALPNIGKLFNKDKVEACESELHNIQTAVVAMLCESVSGELMPVGPTADMARVRTGDTPPLVLADYLQGLEGDFLRTDCTYNFTADGTVTQILPQ